MNTVNSGMAPAGKYTLFPSPYNCHGNQVNYTGIVMRASALKIVILSVAAGLVLAGHCAWAGQISLSTQVQASVQEGRLTVFVSLENQGDEPALHFLVRAYTQGKQITARGPSLLPPQGSAPVELRLPLPAAMPGDYPVLMRVEFQDRNQHSFSALAQGLFSIGPKLPTLVEILQEDSDSAAGGGVSFRFLNKGPQALELKAEFFSPRELELFPCRVRLHLEPGQQERVALKVKNINALPAAVYPILGQAEYKIRGRRYTILGAVKYQVPETSGPLQPARPYLLAAAAALLALILAAEIFHRNRSSRSA
jgi:hypothetical protein